MDSHIHTRTRRPRVLAASAAAVTAAGLLGWAGVTPAAAELTGVGPADTAGHGYPTWYEDGKGLRLDLCLDGPPRCLEGLTDPSQPASVANMPEESFWWAAEASMDLPGGGSALLVLAQEAAWLNEVPEPGQQMSFARVRIRATGLQPGGRYTVTHPYGTDVFTATNEVRNINFTEDTGCTAAPCDFTLAQRGRVGPFLTWDPKVAPAPPAGFIGDPLVDHKVVGSPTGDNFFRISGPGLPSNGVSTDLFSVQGKIATGAQTTPDLTDASDSGRSATDNITNDTSPTFTGFVDQEDATVEILVNGVVAGSAVATGTSYEVPLTGLTPGRKTVQARVAGTDTTSSPLNVTLDTTAPTVSNLTATPNPFNLARSRFTRIGARVNEAADVRMAVLRTGTLVKTLPTRRTTGAGNVLVTWNGTNNARRLVRAGTYTARAIATDVAGNQRTATAPVRVIR